MKAALSAILATLLASTVAIAVMLFAVPAAHSCEFQYCKNQIVGPSKTRAITNTHRQRVGDIYDPGHGRRLQIRNNSRQIIGYIERDGSVTNTHRKKVGDVD